MVWLARHTFQAGHDALGPLGDRAARQPGFPDLVLVHEGIGGGVIFAELKVGRNKLSDKQQTWIDRLQAAGAEAHVWRPSDMWQISRRLKRLDIPKEEL